MRYGKGVVASYGYQCPVSIFLGCWIVNWWLERRFTIGALCRRCCIEGFETGSRALRRGILSVVEIKTMRFLVDTKEYEFFGIGYICSVAEVGHGLR